MAGQLQLRAVMAGKDWLQDDDFSTPATTSSARRPTLRPPAGWPGAGSEPVRPPEVLYVELDGSDLRVGTETWHLQVFAIIDDEAGRWIQLGLTGNSRELTTLHLPPGGGATHVTLALHARFEERRLGKRA